MSEEPTVIVRKSGQLGRITLNRPKALNALDQAMIEAMTSALLEWRDDPGVQAVLVDGAGEKGFCAGGDIRMLAESGKAGDDRAWRFWRDEYRLNTLIAEYPKPYVALIDGVTMGGGVGVSIHGAFRVAGDRTLFAMPETGIGFHPDVGGAYFLPRLPGRIGLWMGLTGARLKTADALAAGVATHYVPSDRHADLIRRLEGATLDHDGEALESVLHEYEADPGASDLAHTRGLIDAAFDGGSVDAIAGRLDAAGDAWSKKQAQTLHAKSPTACELTFETLARGANLSLREVMMQDLRVSMRCLRDGSDFYEGVRAVILDKDNDPAWSEPATASTLEAYFAPLDADHEMTFIDSREP